ncbi:DUF4136 domain-containing protein [Sphingomonas flavalba]|uniref:DUF4136 domain-containing protein n=1 Tax=Sphingomonas flavalba TaxID=2559804 RepID=UPI00109DF8CF|nr:DUF4136 domain-containing protein [Sphingomonas flavalba]
MSISRTILAAAALPLLALGGCASSFSANVSRFQQLPAPQGQTFHVQADDPRLSGGLEFSQYANLISAQLTRVGYRQAAEGERADLTVSVGYGVDKGRERIRSTPTTGFGRWGGGWGWGGWGGWGGYRPVITRHGRIAYVPGFYDPFMWGGWGWDNDVTSYTVYTSQLNMKIDRSADGKRVFEGKAQAISRSNDLPYLVPNLVEAMFTGFPGNSGETVKITVAPPPKG